MNQSLIRLILPLALLAASSGFGCESSHRTLSPQERSNTLPMQADEFAKLGYRVEWRGFPTVLPGGESLTLDILGDAVGSVDSSGVFTMLDARGGSMRWSDQPASPLTRFFGAMRDGNNIYVGSETDTYVYDAATGTLNTKHRMPQVVSTRPAKVGDFIIYGTPTGTVVSILQRNGLAGWSTGVRGGIEQEPVHFGDTYLVAIVSSAGEVLVFDGLTGSGKGRVKLFEGPGAPLAASDTVLFVASRDHSLYAVARDTAEILWQHRTDAPLRHSPAFFKGRLYTDLGVAGLTAMEASTGKILWSAPEVHGDVIAMRSGKLLVVSDNQGKLIDPANGGIVESVKLQGFSIFKAEKFEDGIVYALSPSGVITRLMPR